MRVLILTNLDIGLYKFRKELIENLLKENEVYISVPDGNYIQHFERMGCVIVKTYLNRRGINPFNEISIFLNYRRIIRRLNPELIITYTIKPNIYGGIAARINKKIYATNITGLGTAFESEGILKKIVVGLYKVALKKAKVVFFENNVDRDTFVKLNICKKNNTCVLNGAGVNLEAFSYLAYPNNDVINFLFIGRVMKEKGVDELFLATHRLIEDGIKCSLGVVGPLEENYKNRIEKYSNEGWLKYYGYKDDVRPYIKTCDCFVLPSYHEGMANTNLECAASGRPIITSDIPGCREAVIPGISGFLCEPKNVDSLYESMKHMNELSNEERKEMGRAGRRHMEDVFDKKKVVEKTIANLL